MRLLIQGEAMTDNSGPLNDETAQKNPESDSQNEVGDSSENHRQDIFEETFERLMNGFGETCEKEGVELAVAVARHPDFEEPFVFYRAPHIVDAASLMAEILRQIKGQVFADLDTEPR
jgi:glutamine amidotransferase PdxT